MHRHINDAASDPRRHRSETRLPGAVPLMAIVSTVLVAFGALPSAVVAGPIDDLVAQVSQANYQHILDDMLYTHTGDDRGYGPEHDLAQANIFDHFQSLGLETSLFPFTYNGNEYYDVVGVHEGTVHPEQIYIVGSHYDSVGNPGADDNASGTAAIMEMARVLSRHRFESTIIFIAFDREEQGLKGSSAYAAAHGGDDIRGMISADMIAYNPGGANQAKVFGRSQSDPLKNAMADCLSQWGGIQTTIMGSADFSDHAPFEWQGFQAICLIEYYYNSNPNYHHSTDTVDTPGYIDYEFATNMTRGTLAWLASSAVMVDAMLAGPEPGRAGQVNGWSVSGAAPDTRTFFVYSQTNGTFEVPQCPGLFLGMSQPTLAGSTMTNANGDAQFFRFVPRAAAGRNVIFQAVQPATCIETNPVEHVFE